MIISVKRNFLELKNMKVLICPDHVNNSKPDPEGILQACKKLDIKPENAIYLGDHLNDIKAGICAGVKTIACLYGYSINKNEIDLDYLEIVDEENFNYPNKYSKKLKLLTAAYVENVRLIDNIDIEI